jgi:glycosyltransferase involved in cell wall biosynthesis
LFAKKNILHFQVPFRKVGGRSILNRLKLAKFSHIICNSYFTKKYIDQEYGVASQVVYPPVGVEEFKSGRKENLIISVGHFTKAKACQEGLIRSLHAKKQDILIKVFKKMYDQGLKDWRLALIGGALKEDASYVQSLKNLTRGYPVEIKTNIKFTELKNYYGRAKIYWHATGFGEDEQKYPERMEHFGITTVEAMASGCVPIVINKGGQPEIVTDEVSGRLWLTKRGLANKTLQLIKSVNLWKKLSLQAIKDSQKFSKKVFYQRMDEIIKD